MVGVLRLIVDAGMQKVGQGVLGKVVEKGSEATTTGLLLRSLGNVIITRILLSEHSAYSTQHFH